MRRIHAADPREKEWQALCQQELQLGTNQMCVNLRRKNGEFKGPDEVIEHATEQYAPFIRQVAREYGVDPRAIVGAIMAEGSVNQTANYMAAKQLLVRTQQFFGLSQPGKIAGTSKYISIGFGSLHADAAFAVEQLAARIEKRPVRSEAEVTDLVNNQPEAAIRYIAAVFRDAIDQYAKYGMADKIKNHPEYLVTLYNIGKVNQLAAATAAEKREPRMNFLGLWVKWNLPEIERTTQANPRVEYANGGSAPVQVSSVGAASGPKVAQKSMGVPPANMRVADVVEKAVILSSAPTQCQEGDKTSKATTYQIVATKQKFPAVGTLNPGVPYKVLSPGMGCGFEDWVLVRAEDGTTGWAPKKTVELVYKKSLVAKKPCDSGQQTKCEEKLKQSAKGSFIGKALPGRFFVRLQGVGKKLDWAKPDVQCDADMNVASTAVSAPKAISAEQAAELSEAFKKFKASTLDGIQKAWDEAEDQRYQQAKKDYEEDQKLIAEGKPGKSTPPPYKQSVQPAS